MIDGQSTASGNQLALTLGSGDETAPRLIKEHAPVNVDLLMERILEKGNLFRALHKVRQNRGSAGIDGMTVDDLPAFLKRCWPSIKEQLVTGDYQPTPVRRVYIPKPDGIQRQLGIPTVLDRLIQQAVLQVLQPEWDRSFSHFSFGFRPKRSAHHALVWSQHFINEGSDWVVDIDLEKFFDRVNHDVLMRKVKQRLNDKRLLRLINRYLNVGAIDPSVGGLEEATEGTPQGGPLSPLLANLLLDDLDKLLEKRGMCFVRYADDCNVYVKSQRAGERVMANITRYLTDRLKLRVNEHKSAVDRPWKRSFLGFSFTRKGKAKRRKVSDKALKQLKYNVRVITHRTRGRTLAHVVNDLNRYLKGWKGYFGFTEVLSPLKDLDKWIRRKLRCYIWKQWGRSGYRKLRALGVGRQLAWNTAKSAHGPWRLSGSPALRFGLDNKYFTGLGLVSLVD